MARKADALLPQKVIAALSKKKALRTSADWQIIADHFWVMVKAATAQMEELGALAEYGLAAAAAAVDDIKEWQSIVDDYREMLSETMRLLADHPAAAKLRRKEEALSKAQQARASKPRQRTAALRRMQANFLRADLAAWVREHGSPRGFLKAKAKALGVSTKTLSKYMDGD